MRILAGSVKMADGVRWDRKCKVTLNVPSYPHFPQIIDRGPDFDILLILHENTACAYMGKVLLYNQTREPAQQDVNVVEGQ